MEESYRALEDAAAGRHRREVELFEAAHQSKSEADDKQGPGSLILSGGPILHSPPSADYPFGFDMEESSQSPTRPPDAVGINGLSSGVTEGGYYEPSSSEPPRPTSRRSVYEETQNPELFAPPPPGLFAPFPAEMFPPSPQELFTPQPQELFTPQPQEVFTPPPEESHKVIQVEHASHEADDKPSQKLCLQFGGLTYTVCKKLSRWRRFKRAVLPGYLKSTHPLPKPLRLLDGISGEARDGEILAVMGPSGSGKSTLIDALAQRIDAVKGTMTLNGNRFSERLLRNISAYVMQA